MERIDQARETKGAVDQGDYDLDETNSPNLRLTCECGTFADENNLVRACARLLVTLH